MYVVASEVLTNRYAVPGVKLGTPSMQGLFLLTVYVQILMIKTVFYACGRDFVLLFRRSGLR